MTNPLSAIISGGFQGIVESIGGVLGRFIADPNEKLKAQLELTKIANEYEIAVLAAEKDLAVQQAAVITAEAKSESWIARNWRPLIMLQFGFTIGYNFIISPIFSVQSIPIPPDMWDLLRLGIGGYIIGRSVEKVAPEVTRAIVEGKK